MNFRLPGKPGFFLAVLGWMVLGGQVFAGPANGAGEAWTALQRAFDSQAWNQAAEAGAEFQKNFPDDPQAEAAAFLRGVSLVRAGRPVEALDTLQKLSRTATEGALTSRLPYWEGYAAYACGRWSLAETELLLQTTKTDQPVLVQKAWFYLGVVRQNLKSFDLAVRAFDTFLATSPPNNELKAQALLRKGDLSGTDVGLATTLWKRVLNEVPEARSAPDAALRLAALDGDQINSSEVVGFLKGSLERHPERAEDLLPALADRQESLGNQAEAEKTLQRYLGLSLDQGSRQKAQTDLAFVMQKRGEDPTEEWKDASQGPDPQLGAEAVLQWASLLEKKGKPAQAASGLSRWSDDHLAAKQAESPLWDAVRLYRLAADGAKARRTVSVLVERFPDSPHTPAYILEEAQLAQDAGDETDALRFSDEVSSRFSTTEEAGEARYLTGMIYMRRGEPLRAEGYFYQLMEALGNGRKDSELYQRALLARGLAFLGGGKTDLAEASLRRLLNEKPDGPWAGQTWTALGATLSAERRFAEAADSYKKSLSLLVDDDQRARASWSLADCLSSAQDWQGAAEAFAAFARDFPLKKNALEAVFREGVSLARAKKWDDALAVWEPDLKKDGKGLPIIWWEQAALAELNAGRASNGWNRLKKMELVYQEDKEGVAGVFVRWALAAETAGQADFAQKAYSRVVEAYPDSKASEIALPKAAGALVAAGGDPKIALDRYAAYFKAYGNRPQAVAVLRSACAQMAGGAPDFFLAFYNEAKTWSLSPEADAELRLAWWKSRIDVDSESALKGLSDLAKTAPWSSQRSEALTVAGRWAVRQGHWDQARSFLEAAASQGDDLSVFDARLALADLADGQGRTEDAARLRETAERQSGEGVPNSFKIAALSQAEESWKRLGRLDDVKRVDARLQVLQKELNGD